MQINGALVAVHLQATYFCGKPQIGMEIANPIYDVVFKYLMEDNKSAKIFLSAVTGLEIEYLEYLPQELLVDKNEEVIGDSELKLSIYRLDFSARVRVADGSEKVIIIEVQKTRLIHENMRFRMYLGKQYMNDNFFKWTEYPAGRKYKAGLPILPVYILGDKIDVFSGVPVLDIETNIRSRFTGETFQESNHFIESLFHKGIIINVPALHQKRRDELEKLLSIFDQKNRRKNHHIMNVKETDFPERFRPIIRRLQAAIQERKVRETMQMEDVYVAELKDYAYLIWEAEQGKKEAAEKIEEANRKTAEANRKTAEAVKLLIRGGLTAEDISEKLDIPLEEIHIIINS